MNSNLPKINYKIKLCSSRSKVFTISVIAIFISIIGFFLSTINPSINAPLKPGLDFTGGTQIKLERKCDVQSCSKINPDSIKYSLKSLTIDSIKNGSKFNLSNSKVQLLDNSKSIIVRLPFLSADITQLVINNLSESIGPIEKGGLSVDAIGPKLGIQLLKSSIISLIVAFVGIVIYISFRFDRKYAILAMLALIHDVIIVCGIFSWLGILLNIEINSLFAVALLTIAGYSVNDTVVIFDRIRELNKLENYSPMEKIDYAVSASLTRTLYTSGSTLLPLLALVFLGGPTLKLFAIALSLGVVIGSWSSIALAPSLLSLFIKSSLAESALPSNS